MVHVAEIIQASPPTEFCRMWGKVATLKLVAETVSDTSKQL